MTFTKACVLISEQCPNAYARAYAKAGLSHPEMLNLRAQQTQALYILNNMTHWRGDLATQLREWLRNFANGRTA